MGYGMRTFQRRDNAFEGAEFAESRQGFIVGDGDVFRPPEILEKSVFRPNPRIIESGRNRVGLFYLAVLIL